MPQTLSPGAANEDVILLEDWDFPTGDKLAELEQTGANAVQNTIRNALLKRPDHG